MGSRQAGGGEAMSDTERRCGTCKWFEFEVGPTGRKRPSEPGKCKYPVPWPEKWPRAYVNSYGERPKKPFDKRVFALGERPPCDCWEVSE